VIALSAQTRVYLAKAATDMRKSFRGLLILTESVLEQQPASGHLFVFLNRRRDLMKILYWDGTGYVIWYKRLERGRFQMPELSGAAPARLELSAAQLGLILEGIDLNSARQRLRYRAAEGSPQGASSS
jgi:transposase